MQSKLSEQKFLNISFIIFFISVVTVTACQESSVYFIDNEMGSAESKSTHSAQKQYSDSLTTNHENAESAVIAKEIVTENSLKSCEPVLQTTHFSTDNSQIESRQTESQGIVTEKGFFLIESLDDQLLLSSFEKNGEKLFSKTLLDGIVETDSLILKSAYQEKQYIVIFNAKMSENNPISPYQMIFNEQGEITQGIDFVLPASLTRGRDSYVQEIIPSQSGILIRWMQKDQDLEFSQQLTYLNYQKEIRFNRDVSHLSGYETSFAFSDAQILMFGKSAQNDLVLETLDENGKTLHSLTFPSSSQYSSVRILQLIPYQNTYSALFSEEISENEKTFHLIKLAIFNDDLSEIVKTLVVADSREFSDEYVISFAQAGSHETILSLLIERTNENKNTQVLFKQIDLNSLENTSFTTVNHQVFQGSKLFMQNNAIMIMSSDSAGFVLTSAQCDNE